MRGRLQLYVPSMLHDGERWQQGWAVAVDGGAIHAVGPRESVESTLADAAVIDWSGLAMIPGLVNAHCHSFQSLLRGFAADVPFLEWRDRALYRYSPLLGPDAVYAGALLAFGEMLRYGVTTVADFFYVHAGGLDNDEAVIAAAHDLGIRLVFARTMYDWHGAPSSYQESIPEAVERTRTLFDRFQGDPLVAVCPAPHSLHAASPDMIRAGHALARELGTRFHIHVAEEQFEVDEVLAEYGCRPVELLDRLGVVDESMVAIHLVWLSEGEVATLGRRGAKLAYCPSSNMFLADGVTPLSALRRAGVRAGLGTDGACSNNRSSVLEEARMASLLHKVSSLDASVLTARDVFGMATAEGAEVLGLPVGRLAPGMRADLAGLDLADLSLQPAPVPGETLLTNLVYAMQPHAVRRVVVEGREVVADGRLRTVSEERIRAHVERVVLAWPPPGEAQGG